MYDEDIRNMTNTINDVKSRLRSMSGMVQHSMHSANKFAKGKILLTTGVKTGESRLQIFFLIEIAFIIATSVWQLIFIKNAAQRKNRALL